MDELMVVKQLPIIEENLKAISAVIKEKLAIVDGLVCSEESVGEVKKIRAEFRSEFAQLEEQRKAIKASVMEPYMRFEAVYKECVSDQYDAADIALKDKVNSVENELRASKKAEVKAYFDEYATANNVSGYADFDRQIKRVNLSDTMASLKRACKQQIDSIVSGLAVIDTQPEALKGEILAEYKKTLDAATAICTVSERHKEIEEAKARQKAFEEKRLEASEAVAKVDVEIQHPEPLARPVAKPADDDPVMRVTFTVTAKRSELRELKQYLNDNGYKYE